MEKQILVFCSTVALVFSSLIISAQTQWVSPGTTSMGTNQQFLIGSVPAPGTGNPVRKLVLQGDSPWLVIKDTIGDVNGDTKPTGLYLKNNSYFGYQLSTYYFPSQNSSAMPTFSIRAYTGGAPITSGIHIVTSNSFKIGGPTNGTLDGTLDFNTSNTNARGPFSTYGSFTARNGFQSISTTVANYFAGKIQVGSTRILNGSTDYLLSVDGKINCQKLVCSVNNWADYVFDKDYNLMPLPDLEKYIKTAHHLPGIPSETEVKTNGVDVVEMNTLLLKKMEEMTLYIIELEKRLKLVEAATK